MAYPFGVHAHDREVVVPRPGHREPGEIYLGGGRSSRSRLDDGVPFYLKRHVAVAADHHGRPRPSRDVRDLPGVGTRVEDQVTAGLPVLDTYKKSTEYVTKRYGMPWDNEFDQALSVQLINGMNGKTSPKYALDSAQKTAQGLVKKYLKN
jgi:hypothetical protein